MAVAPMLVVVVLLLLARGAFSMLLGRPPARSIPRCSWRPLRAGARWASTAAACCSGRETWFRRWESRIACGLVVVIGFELIGWFDTTQRLLDSIS